MESSKDKTNNSPSLLGRGSGGEAILSIISPNILSVIGLKSILESVMPIARIDIFSSFDELIAGDADKYFHYFVSTTVAINHRQFFLDRRRKTIVLSPSAESNISDFHCINTNQSEQQIVKSILALEQSAHQHGRNLPVAPQRQEQNILSNREIEVLCLIVQGYINKEIADRLNISVTTVITHRKNIMEKLGAKSVSALTIYAVMHGYVDIDKI